MRSNLRPQDQGSNVLRASGDRPMPYRVDVGTGTKSEPAPDRNRWLIGTGARSEPVAKMSGIEKSVFERENGCRRPGGESELVVDVLHVVSRRLRRDAEPRRHLAIRSTLRHQAKHL